MDSPDLYRDGPRIGDALGEICLRAARGEAAMEVYEREDGYVFASDAAKYVEPPDEWLPIERRVLHRVRGRILDVGCGVGRVALPLQERGESVVGLDVSATVVEAARIHGVRELVNETVHEHAERGARYDTFLLLGANLGLLESRESAPRFLASLRSMAAPGARVIGSGVDPHGFTDPLRLENVRRNLSRGRMAGQNRGRIRFGDLATPWFDYLTCSIDELKELLEGTGWRLDEVDQEGPAYCADMCVDA